MDIVKDNSEEENVDIYFCGICFEGTKPTMNSNIQNQPGVRLFDKSKDDPTDKTLSRELRNLKTMVKSHLKTKTHLLKFKIKKTNTQKMKERSNRY